MIDIIYEDDYIIAINKKSGILVTPNNPTDKNLTDTNTIKSLYLDEIKFAKFPKIGTPTLYYQNPLKFATDYISTEHSIETHLNYNILKYKISKPFIYMNFKTILVWVGLDKDNFKLLGSVL